VAGVVLHIHDGEYTVFSSAFQDPLLVHITDTSLLAVVSVEYIILLLTMRFYRGQRIAMMSLNGLLLIRCSTMVLGHLSSRARFVCCPSL
jgi:hypothetical protein